MKNTNIANRYFRFRMKYCKYIVTVKKGSTSNADSNSIIKSMVHEANFI